MAIAKCPTILAAGMLAAVSVIVSAQTTTSTSETKKFEVIAVDGNNLVVKLPEGTRHIDVPPGFMFTVDGKQLSVQELKPGMAGTATITKTTTVTPVTVTEVRNGTVVQQNGPSIIVRTDEGIRMFTQADVNRRGATMYRNGRPAQISSFRAGDRLTATIVTEKPPTVVTEQEVNARLAAGGAGTGAGAGAGTGAGATRAPANTGTAGTTGAAGAAGAPTPAPRAAGGTGSSGGRTLPKTASPLPLVGLFGGLALLAGAGLTARRLFAR